MLLCFYLFISSLLILDVQTEVSLLSLYSSMKMYVQVNDVEDLENDHFAIPGELHDVNRREAGKGRMYKKRRANKKMQMRRKIQR